MRRRGVASWTAILFSAGLPVDRFNPDAQLPRVDHQTGDGEGEDHFAKKYLQPPYAGAPPGPMLCACALLGPISPQSAQKTSPEARACEILNRAKMSIALLRGLRTARCWGRVLSPLRNHAE